MWRNVSSRCDRTSRLFPLFASIFACHVTLVLTYSVMRTCTDDWLVIVGSRKIVSIILSFYHGSGAFTSFHDPMDNETLANELARQGVLLQEAQQAVRRLEQLVIQADQRSKLQRKRPLLQSQPSVWSRPPSRGRSRSTTATLRSSETYTADHEELRGVPERGRDVPECSGTRLVGETAAGMGCRLPRPGDRDE